ncbi:hypothetical protein J7E97_10920 [Streptomyces sp. ISL-66]|uniref:hypothetical protein n=1 Tax=Streptomyces sp. ISL-66 TaxID=2819186 RepID=UPI001BE5045D|nr:hypothetical protein [Streptomyces sp. ISL-66]MBT2468376.1 hypothetical protein [Streptomyces sp. ISL-66]
MLATSSDAKFTIFHAATGSVLATAANSGKMSGSWNCRYDEQPLVLCAPESGAGTATSIVVIRASNALKL